MRLLVVFVVAAPAAVWLLRRVVRKEIAATDAAWDKHVTESMAVANPLGPIFGPAADRMAERLRSELDDPNAVNEWLWRDRA